jgi:hypothetical protein
MPDQSFGTWKITDVIGATVPKRVHVELVLDGEDLRFRSADGTVDAVVPASRCRYKPYGKRNGFLDLGPDAAWLTTDDEGAASELEEALSLRFVPATPAPSAPETDPTEPTFSRVYRAATPDAAAKVMAAAAERFSGLGYTLVGQSWAEPDRSSTTALQVGGVLVFLFGLLFLANIVISLIIWAVAVLLFVLSSGSPGDGTLLATFERRGRVDGAASGGSITASVATAPAPPAPTTRDRLVELTQLRDEGLISEDEWAAKRQDLLREL